MDGLVRRGRPHWLGLPGHTAVIAATPVSFWIALYPQRHGLEYQQGMQPDGGQQHLRPVCPHGHDRSARPHLRAAGYRRSGLELSRLPGRIKGLAAEVASAASLMPSGPGSASGGDSATPD